MIQKVLKFLLPKKYFKKIEQESRKWFIECPSCGFSRSYWEAGGVRVAFDFGKRKVIFGRCPQCKEFKLFTVTRKD